jgi:hypothetical protein
MIAIRAADRDGWIRLKDFQKYGTLYCKGVFQFDKYPQAINAAVDTIHSNS